MDRRDWLVTLVQRYPTVCRAVSYLVFGPAPAARVVALVVPTVVEVVVDVGLLMRISCLPMQYGKISMRFCSVIMTKLGQAGDRFGHYHRLQR